MTCDDIDFSDKANLEERDLKRKLDKESFKISGVKMSCNGNDAPRNKVPKQDIGEIKNDIIVNSQSLLVHECDKNSRILVEDNIKCLPIYSTKKKTQLEIETEFKILQSLIPNIANKQQINEVRWQNILSVVVELFEGYTLI